MERALVVQHCANKLFATENSIDQAIADAAALVSELVKARHEIGFSAILGDESFAKATAALAALGQARSAVVAAHHDMADAKLRLGVRTKLAGAGEKPPQNQSSAVPLRQVG
jgi:hypothetical protein